MSSSDQRENNKYQFLESISTEKLKSMIVSDFLSGDSEDEANDEFMTQALEVIAGREEQDPSAPQFDVEAGWEKFEAEFFPAENSAPQKKTRQIKRNTADKKKSLSSKRLSFKALRAAAVAAAVIFLSVMMASAFEPNLFNMIAVWTQDMFQFKCEDIPQYGIKVVEEPQLNQALTPETALEEHEISTLVWPTWYPEEFELSDTQVYDDISEPLIGARYIDKSTDRSLYVDLIIHRKPRASIHEKDDTPVKTYLKNDIVHYIMRNNDFIVATWMVGNLEGTITGEISEDELKAMIDSIYEGDSD